MQFGVNWISPKTLPIIRSLIDQCVADFCEIMVDNFAHLPPAMIREALPHTPIALHIVRSRFLEKSSQDLRELARSLRPWINDLEPLYVSDHLAQFATTNGRYLPFTTELDYKNIYSHVRQRILEWQSLLDRQILFENYASLHGTEVTQSDFFEKLLQETNAGLLFDFSNAYIAQYNQVGDAALWNRLAQETKCFHVAGFRIDQSTKLAMDTHDAPIADQVLKMMKHHFAARRNLDDATIVVEFDANIDFDLWKNELLKVKACQPFGDSCPLRFNSTITNYI